VAPEQGATAGRRIENAEAVVRLGCEVFKFLCPDLWIQSKERVSGSAVPSLLTITRPEPEGFRTAEVPKRG
jgi:hypothetical protein